MSVGFGYSGSDSCEKLILINVLNRPLKAGRMGGPRESRLGNAPDGIPWAVRFNGASLITADLIVADFSSVLLPRASGSGGNVDLADLTGRTGSPPDASAAKCCFCWHAAAAMHLWRPSDRGSTAQPSFMASEPCCCQSLGSLLPTVIVAVAGAGPGSLGWIWV